MIREMLPIPGRRGFSLIELMLVIAILAIAAAMAAPRYGNAMDRYHADAAARRVAADLNLAQSRAQSTSSSRSIAFNVANGTYLLSSERGLNVSTASYNVNLAHAPYFGTISTASFGGNPTITFNGYGVPDNAGSVQINSGGVTKTITVTADSGAISVQ